MTTPDTTQTTPAELTPGSPEYNAAMAAKYRGEETPTDAPARPEHIPEKFWDATTGQVRTDDLLKSYTELERKLSGGKPAAPADEQTPAQTSPIALPPGSEEPVADTVRAAGLDPDVLVQKIGTQGDLDEADYAALQKAGVPRSLAEQYVRMGVSAASANRELTTIQAIAYAGGEAEADKLMQWAGTALPEDEKVRLNAKLASPDWKDAIDVLKAKRAAADPTAREPVSMIAGNPTGSPTGYSSRAQMVADMSDPRYDKDPAFRRAVAQKLRHSNFHEG